MNRFEQISSTENKSERRKTFDRRWLVKAVTALGFMAIIESCALKDNEIEGMPITEISQLIKNPDKFTRGVIKTVGYTEKIASRVEDDSQTVITPKFDSKGHFTGFDSKTFLIKRSIDEYALREKRDKPEESFPIIIMDENKGTFMPDAPKLPILQNNELYRLVGSVETVKGNDGKPKYILRVSASVDQYRTPYNPVPEATPFAQ